MKILYAIQATGNGHISRAKEIIPHLAKYGKVHTVISGSNATIDIGFEKNYTSSGLSLFYKKCGGLDYLAIASKNNLSKVYKDISKIPVEKYDLIINDFDYITSSACRRKGVKSIHFGHQASFNSPNTPRPSSKSIIGEYILKNYCSADYNLGLHFQAYDDFILPPIIKSSVLNAKPKDNGHITVYLPSYDQSCLEKHFRNLKHLQFEWFLPHIKSKKKDGNITFFPVNSFLFDESMIHCHGVITGGGFETPSEVLYLGKKLMAIPIRNHYEQKCNATALKKMGCFVLEDIVYNTWEQQVIDWLETSPLSMSLEANDIDSTLQLVVEKGAR